MTPQQERIVRERRKNGWRVMEERMVHGHRTVIIGVGHLRTAIYPSGAVDALPDEEEPAERVKRALRGD